jgi:tRNA-2-methylthio-N6-dimethylallyladenosine synthase
LGIIDSVREAIPNAAISTDIIVGFPGETEEDFLDTMRVVSESRFATAYTFQYSIRPGTPAGEMSDQIPKAVVQERFERLHKLVNQIAFEENQKIIGQTVEVLVANNEGRKDAATNRLSGRARDGRLVHFSVPQGVLAPRPGDLATVTVEESGPFHLIADPKTENDIVIGRTIAGDAWDRAQAASCAVPAPATPGRRSIPLGVRGA